MIGLTSFPNTDAWPLFLAACLLPLAMIPLLVPSLEGDVVVEEPEEEEDGSDVLLEERCLFFMTSVFKDSGLTTPCNFKNNPHALHRGLP